MNRLILTILMIAFASGCSVYQINSKDTTDDYYPPKTNIDDVAYAETVGDKPYIQIAEVTVTTERRQPFDEVLPKLKQEAGMLGADAITDVESDATDFWKKLPTQKLIGKAYVRTTYTAKAIVWKDSSGSTAAPSS